jgi:hypothetical protein
MSNPMLLLDLIDFRSFSNLWYWITLCVIWSSASHWVLGVPHDMVARARREGGEALDWLETLARINTGRLLFHSREYGPWVVGVACFLISTLGVLAFAYGNEFSLALLLILAPLMILAYLTLRAALRVEAGEGQGDALFRLMFRTRLMVQGLGMASIFVTALVGMYVNLMHFIPH